MYIQVPSPCMHGVRAINSIMCVSNNCIFDRLLGIFIFRSVTLFLPKLLFRILFYGVKIILNLILTHISKNLLIQTHTHTTHILIVTRKAHKSPDRHRHEHISSGYGCCQRCLSIAHDIKRMCQVQTIARLRCEIRTCRMGRRKKRKMYENKIITVSRSHANDGRVLFFVLWIYWACVCVSVGRIITAIKNYILLFTKKKKNRTLKLFANKSKHNVLKIAPPP